MRLEPLLHLHHSRRAADKQAIMTMVTRRVSAKYRECALGEAPLLLAVDADTDQLLDYVDDEEYAMGEGSVLKWSGLDWTDLECWIEVGFTDSSSFPFPFVLFAHSFPFFLFFFSFLFFLVTW